MGRRSNCDISIFDVFERDFTAAVPYELESRFFERFRAGVELHELACEGA